MPGTQRQTVFGALSQSANAVVELGRHIGMSSGSRDQAAQGADLGAPGPRVLEEVPVERASRRVAAGATDRSAITEHE
jgi:hypothetical protein